MKVKIVSAENDAKLEQEIQSVIENASNVQLYPFLDEQRGISHVIILFSP